MSRASWLALFWLLGLAISSPAAQMQASAPILPGSEQLWQTLESQALTLPQAYDSFMASLTDQINSLQTSNDSLTQTNQSLQDSNTSLQTSNSSLTLRNADLQNSLQTSQQAVATLENKSALLQKALDDSMLSTTRAESDTKALAVKMGILKVSIWIATPVAVVALGYIGGHALGWWR